MCLYCPRNLDNDLFLNDTYVKAIFYQPSENLYHTCAQLQLSTCVIQIFSGLIQTNYYMSCSVSHIAKVGGVKRNAAWCSFIRVHNVTDCLLHNYARDNQDFPVSPCKCVCIALEI